MFPAHAHRKPITLSALRQFPGSECSGSHCIPVGMTRPPERTLMCAHGERLRYEFMAAVSIPDWLFSRIKLE